MIIIKTEINAPIERVFDLARSMDFHKKSLRDTGEEIIGGTSIGLIGINETVTFRGRHFGIRQELTAKITHYDYPNKFTDEMIKGSFKSLKHIHEFTVIDSKTLMVDKFSYTCPMGLIGKLFDWMILRSYMKNILVNRANEIKNALESSDWKLYLKN